MPDLAFLQGFYNVGAPLGQLRPYSEFHRKNRRFLIYVPPSSTCSALDGKGD